ncbi:hypothetical protein [Agromyces humi]|uniref:hypothetical protein n=1 Tax=Agromyces humi TaxID=1766800 RepID=UPI00135C4DE9|nr:hypothetical protein [Agromyces humi]
MGTARSWAEYVYTALGVDAADAVAAVHGLDRELVADWLRGAAPRAEDVVLFARAFGLDVVDALVAAEVITAQEARPRLALSEYSELDLTLELHRRAKLGLL